MTVRPYEAASKEFRSNGWWEGVTLGHLFAGNADANPSRLALADPPNRADVTVGEPTRWTYAELRVAADRLATDRKSTRLNSSH